MRKIKGDMDNVLGSIISPLYIFLFPAKYRLSLCTFLCTCSLQIVEFHAQRLDLNTHQFSSPTDWSANFNYSLLDYFANLNLLSFNPVLPERKACPEKRDAHQRVHVHSFKVWGWIRTHGGVKPRSSTRTKPCRCSLVAWLLPYLICRSALSTHTCWVGTCFHRSASFTIASASISPKPYKWLTVRE